ncbi:MAG: DUF4065 domain-containing protein [Cytophagales bacterium]|nr:DUF4065 domain-containing protein [Cytophagales bacterium]
MTIAMTQSSTLAIANFFIRKSLKEKKPVTQIKLQKLIFFAHGFYLAIKEKPLVDEKIEAWQYGPVIPSVYHRFKKWGNNSIDEVLLENGNNLIINQEDIDFLELVWHKFSSLSASQLIKISHETNGPWNRAIEKSKALVGFVVPNIIINNIDIYWYFKKRFVQNSIDRFYSIA